MIKVTFRPWEEVIIHEAIKYSLPDLLRLAGFGVQPGGLAAPLHWAEGVVFQFVPMPPTDDVVKESLQGKVHWLSVTWALMPEYRNVIPIADINAKIPVIDMSATDALCEVAKALKAQTQK